MTVAQAGVSDIFGTDHDLGTTAVPTCMQCHTPHKAKGPYLWARDFSAVYPSLTGLMKLCFSCHDGGVTNVGEFMVAPGIVNHEVNVGVEGEDCDRCHDPHVDNWKFVTDTAIPTEYRNANLCSACHTGDIGVSHPLVETNKPIDRVWNPYASPADFSGTRLFNAAGDTEVPTGTGNIKCATCHVPHGSVDAVGLNSMLYVDPASEHSPICENCHQ
ncbi:MAG: cytochrome c3 family protein [Chloroflexota bacterium]|nr:cytochrome c3 family protein [Chloroflexota bacterium]